MKKNAYMQMLRFEIMSSFIVNCSGGLLPVSWIRLRQETY